MKFCFFIIYIYTTLLFFNTCKREFEVIIGLENQFKINETDYYEFNGFYSNFEAYSDAVFSFWFTNNKSEKIEKAFYLNSTFILANYSIPYPNYKTIENFPYEKGIEGLNIYHLYISFDGLIPKKITFKLLFYFEVKENETYNLSLNEVFFRCDEISFQDWTFDRHILYICQELTHSDYEVNTFYYSKNSLFTLTCGDLIYKTDNDTNTYIINQRREITKGFRIMEVINKLQCKKIIAKVIIEDIFLPLQYSIRYYESMYKTFLLPPITHQIKSYIYKVEFNKNDGITAVVISMATNNTAIFLRKIFGNFDSKLKRVNSLNQLFYEQLTLQVEEIHKRDRSITLPGLEEISLIMLQCFDDCQIEFDVYEQNKLDSNLDINQTMDYWYQIEYYSNFHFNPGEYKIRLEILGKQWMNLRGASEFIRINEEKRIYKTISSNDSKFTWKATTEVADFRIIVDFSEEGEQFFYGQKNITISEENNRFLFILKKENTYNGTSLVIRSYDKMELLNIVFYKYCSFDQEGFYFYPNEHNSLPQFLNQIDREYKDYIKNPFKKESLTTGFNNKDNFYCTFYFIPNKNKSLHYNLTVDITYDNKDDIKHNQLNLLDINENTKNFFIINQNGSLKKIIINIFKCYEIGDIQLKIGNYNGQYILKEVIKETRFNKIIKNVNMIISFKGTKTSFIYQYYAINEDYKGIFEDNNTHLYVNQTKKDEILISFKHNFISLEKVDFDVYLMEIPKKDKREDNRCSFIGKKKKEISNIIQEGEKVILSICNIAKNGDYWLDVIEREKNSTIVYKIYDRVLVSI